MALLQLEEIYNLINSDTPDWVNKARKDEKKLQVHINGIGTVEYLTQIEGIENEKQFALRKKTATSNKFVFENLLRPVDKCFSASGGSRFVRTKTDSSKELLLSKIEKFHGGYGLKKWIQEIQSGKYYSSPNGVVFFEWNETETYPTFKDIAFIKNYQRNGRNLEWIVFEGVKRTDEIGKEKPGEYFRVVDSFADYLFYKLDKNITLVEEETYFNPFQYVPAFTNSNILDSTLTYNVSPVASVIDLADHYLRTTSVKNIYEFLHGYPIFWAYVEPCRACDGTGLYNGETCHVCNGDRHTFRKDVTDVIKLKTPTSNDEPKLAPDIAGYIQPDLETWKEQRIELEWIYNLMNYSVWGTIQERAENETATGAFIDVQPVNDRLNKFSDAFEQTEKLIIDIIGKYYLLTNYDSCSVNYGRRFLVEPPDKVWQKYQEAKAKGAPKEVLNYMLIQYYQSEFKDDAESLAVAQKAVLIEPFIHKSDEEIDKLPITQEDKAKKYYFNEWWKSLKRDDIIMKTPEQLNAMFDTYILTKKIQNDDARQETPGVQGDGMEVR